MAWNGYETKMEGLITEAAEIFAEYFPDLCGYDEFLEKLKKLS